MQNENTNVNEKVSKDDNDNHSSIYENSDNNKNKSDKISQSSRGRSINPSLKRMVRTIFSLERLGEKHLIAERTSHETISLFKHNNANQSKPSMETLEIAKSK